MKIDEIYKQIIDLGEYDAFIIAGLSKNEDEAPVGINGKESDLVVLAGLIACTIRNEMGEPTDAAQMVSKFREILLADVKKEDEK